MIVAEIVGLMVVTVFLVLILLFVGALFGRIVNARKGKDE